MAKKSKQKNHYLQIIEAIFLEKYREGTSEIIFEREDIVRHAKRLRIAVPKNLGDVIYSFRYRADFPDSIRSKAPAEQYWVIQGVGPAKYRFSLSRQPKIVPSSMLLEIKVPDATPGLIEMYALNDEQALLAKLRYNRLIDLFTGLTCYALQSHLRTSVRQLGQTETDELYVAVDRAGSHYVIPVQAKGGKDQISVVQIEQDIAMCEDKFPQLICRPIAAQFMRGELIALFECVRAEEQIAVVLERHYRLVPPDQISAEDLDRYRDHVAGTPLA